MFMGTQTAHACASGIRRAAPAARLYQTRLIGRRCISRAVDSEWLQKEADIRAGKRKSMLALLEERGLVHQIAGNRKDLEELLTSKRVGAYCGVDPTASSLHVGHLLPLMSLFWLYINGFHGVMLLGGATSRIGDPSGRLKTRGDMPALTHAKNLASMHRQMQGLWANVESCAQKYGYLPQGCGQRQLLDNAAWMNELSLMDFLAVIGPGARMGAMMAKDTVKNKMKNGDGMSFAEFTYPLLQAWDWWHMYNKSDVQLQIGGADQYGNITAGMDAIKYIIESHTEAIHPRPRGVPMGFTVPLLTTSSGQKFGKSAGNAIWLDQALTSAFDLYGYFMKQSDADVDKFLRLFTFMPLSEIDALMADHNRSPKERRAQRKLASEFLELVHGRQEAEAVEAQHYSVFGSSNLTSPPARIVKPKDVQPENSGVSTKTNNNNLGEPVALSLTTNLPSPNVTIARSIAMNSNIASFCKIINLTSSTSEANRLLQQRGLYFGSIDHNLDSSPTTSGVATISFSPVDPNKRSVQDYIIRQSLLIFRRGKDRVKIVQIVDDEIWRKEVGLPNYLMPNAPNAMEKVAISPNPTQGIEEILINHDDDHDGASSLAGPKKNSVESMSPYTIPKAPRAVHLRPSSTERDHASQEIIKMSLWVREKSELKRLEEHITRTCPNNVEVYRLNVMGGLGGPPQWLKGLPDQLKMFEPLVSRKRLPLPVKPTTSLYMSLQWFTLKEQQEFRAQMVNYSNKWGFKIIECPAMEGLEYAVFATGLRAKVLKAKKRISKKLMRRFSEKARRQRLATKYGVAQAPPTMPKAAADSNCLSSQPRRLSEFKDNGSSTNSTHSEVPRA